MALKSHPILEGVTYSRLSAGAAIGPNGNLASVPAGQIRQDYDPVTRAYRGMLIERGSTRLNTHLTAGAAGYVSTGVNLTQLADNVLGQFPGVEVATQGQSYQRLGVVQSLSAGAQCAFQFLVRPGSSGKAKLTAYNSTTLTTSEVGGIIGTGFNGISSGAGAFTGLKTVVLPDGTYWYSGVFVPSADGVFSIGVGPDSAVAGETVKFYAMQLEYSSCPTSLILGDGAATTRAPDLFDIDLAARGYANPQALTIHMDFEVEWRLTGGSLYPLIFCLAHPSDDADRIVGVLVAQTGQLAAQVYSDRQAQMTVYGPTNTEIKHIISLAMAVAANNGAVSINGSSPVTDTDLSMAAPFGRTVMRIGGNTVNTGSHSRVWLRAGADHCGLILYPYRKSNAELQALTA